MMARKRVPCCVVGFTAWSFWLEVEPEHPAVSRKEVTATF